MAIQNNPTSLQVKGFNPYNSAIYGRKRPVSVPIRPKPKAAPSAFQVMGVDSYQSSISSPATELKAKNLSYRLLDGHLNIKLPYANVTLNDPTPEDPMHLEGLDVDLHLNAAQVRVSDIDVTMSVGHILSQNAKLPLQDIRVAFAPNDSINVEGKARLMGIKFPFKVEGQMGVQPDGELRYDLKKVKVMGLSVLGLLNTFGVNLEKLTKLTDPSKGYYTRDNSVFVNINRITEQPGITGRLQGARTHLGDLELTFGDTAEDVQEVKDMSRLGGGNYLQLSGGHFYYDGYFVKDGLVRLEDKTPGSPLRMEQDGETLMDFKQGYVGVTDYKFAELIRGKLGDDSSLKNVSTSLEPHAARLGGNMYGFLPISMDLVFDKTQQGQLMLTPRKPKAFGFIPLPEKFVGKQVQKMVDGGIPYGNGVAIPDLGDTKLGNLTHVSHQAGYLILRAEQ